MRLKIVFFVIVGALFLIVLLQNTRVVSLQLLFWEVSMSRIVLLPLVMVIGFIAGFFVGRKSWDW